MEKARTEKEIAGVSKILQEVVWEAWVLSKQPFVCTDGLRTVEEQKLLVAKGASKTMRSKHIEGKAVDLTSFIGSPLSLLGWLDSTSVVSIASMNIIMICGLGNCVSRLAVSTRLTIASSKKAPDILCASTFICDVDNPFSSTDSSDSVIVIFLS